VTVAGEFTPEDLRRLENLHHQVDEQATELAGRLGPRLVCRRGCHDCCQDDLTVLEIEAALIRQHCGDLLAEADPAPTGGCAFLDDQGACRIYPWRPYVCRTQGLPLRWFADQENHKSDRDICPLNVEALHSLGESLADLPDTDCWTIGPWEGRLASLQAEASGQFELRREPLRSLFAHSR
jgi:hypothetical protein